MAFEDYDEYEQGEQVRKWIKENGIAVVVGVLLALALIFGWRQWQAHKTNHAIQAASQFAVIQDAIQADNKQAMDAALQALQKDYADTAYAALGSAAVARHDVDKNDLKAAGQHLRWAMAHSKQPALESLFALRLARVQIAQNHAQQAITTLDGIPAGGYDALVAELRGDALLKLGKSDEARSAYRQAMAKLDKDDAAARHLLQMKLDNLTQPKAAPTGAKAQ
jgi:predicted negative regulator of RcsB-dependent stress response